jgi:hypothetical protein
MPLMFTQSLTEKSTRDLDGKARPASTACYKDSFTFIALWLIPALLREMQLTVNVSMMQIDVCCRHWKEINPEIFDQCCSQFWGS